MNGFIHFADPSLATSLSFPGLGLDFALNREAIFIGPLTIYWYGVIVVAGIALGVFYALWRAGQFGLNRDKVSDIIMYSILAGIVGARIYYVAFSWDYYKVHPNEIIAIWKGGIAFYGGVMGALLCAAILCRLWKVPLLRGTDAALGGLLLGQSIGRWGNFVNIEAFGDYFEGAWRMVSPAIDSYLHIHPDLLPGFTPERVAQMQNIPVHPTFFYESAWTMLGFLFLLWYTRRRKFNGELTLFYFFWNGVGRTVIEGLRTDSLFVGTVRVSQLLAAMMAVVSVLIWLLAQKKLKDGTAPGWMLLSTTASEIDIESVSEADTTEDTAADLNQTLFAQAGQGAETLRDSAQENATESVAPDEMSAAEVAIHVEEVDTEQVSIKK